MQYESPSQDPRLTVDERLKLLYPMVNIIFRSKIFSLFFYYWLPDLLPCPFLKLFLLLQVNEEETPLPRSWSTKDKYQYIGLSQSNLRVHYKVPISSFPFFKNHPQGDGKTLLKTILRAMQQTIKTN